MMDEISQQALWNSTKESLKEISDSCKTRPEPWVGIGKMADEIVSRIVSMETSLAAIARKEAVEGQQKQSYVISWRFSLGTMLISFSNFPYLLEKLVRQLDIHNLVGDLKFEVDLAALECKHRPQPDYERVCHEEVCESALAEIELWARDFDKPPVYWLNGLCGTGKSTIARTMAKRMDKDGQLGASFFCSRDSKDRSDPFLIPSTLAIQLTRKFPKFRSVLVIRKGHTSLRDQVDDFLVKPLARSAISTVIVIDALDECEDGESFLSVLGQLAPEIPNVKFLITSGTEQNIQHGFDLWGESNVQTAVLESE